MDSSPLFTRAQRVLPGGVTAAARANPALGQPFYVARAEGPFVFAADGRRYVDLCMSNGATLLGHGHPNIVAAVRRAADFGFACGHDGEPQVRLAERLVEQIPAFEQVRFTSSGTEATFYALRVARAATGRTGVLKFEGHFHGFNDALAFSFWPGLGEAGPPDAPHTHAETAGLPPDTAAQVVVAPFNDATVFRRLLDRHGDHLAAVILEPINYDSGAILPDPTFLATVREETARRGIVLIFDEILSGYRTGPSGAQGYLGVTPDLATLGKALGGGVPLSAFGGRRELMDLVAPRGPAVHTGTYNAHLIPILAAHAFLDTISEVRFYERLLGSHERLYCGLRVAFAAAGLPVRVQGVGARFGLYFGLDPERAVTTYRDATSIDKVMQHAFCREMDTRGVYVAPAWHHGLCAMHTDELVDQVADLAERSARAVAAYAAPAGG
jgi:glutamate-1-semialdehyde 2,1-aminomutase